MSENIELTGVSEEVALWDFTLIVIVEEFTIHAASTLVLKPKRAHFNVITGDN